MVDQELREPKRRKVDGDEGVNLGKYSCHQMDSTSSSYTKWRPQKYDRPLNITDKAHWFPLFGKRLTKGDVDTLDTLIFSVHEESKLPRLDDDEKIPMEFVDEKGAVWEFGYKKGKRGPSLVTNQWIQYVRENSLQEGDIVCFYKKMLMNPLAPKFGITFFKIPKSN
ncbi:hypothetical protein SELMODRAFT_417628 [Selaginella moellendorffii]|uniref:TF-B3 domain-containing protein n=1 Tax=Selaginella moellendorffii TaxID=88036 RepID=D8S324_SELML|nr:hypothetical protein SELMODRAFT_417628 [Selaginella moellendorffii]